MLLQARHACSLTCMTCCMGSHPRTCSMLTAGTVRAAVWRVGSPEELCAANNTRHFRGLAVQWQS